MIWASLTLLFSSASQMATPLFFGMVVDAALIDKKPYFNYLMKNNY
jgi:hypothetical protein